MKGHFLKNLSKKYPQPYIRNNFYGGNYIYHHPYI